MFYVVAVKGYNKKHIELKGCHTLAIRMVIILTRVCDVATSK